MQIGLGRAHPTCGRLRADCHRRGTRRSFVEALSDCGHEDPRASGSIGPTKAGAGGWRRLSHLSVIQLALIISIIMYSFNE